MIRWHRRAADVLGQLAVQLQQTRSAKAVTTKLPVVLLKDVEGVGAAGAVAKVNHGFARNFLVPKRAARALPTAKQQRQAAGAQVAVAVSSSGSSSSSGGAAEAAEVDPAALRRRQESAAIAKLTNTTVVVKRKTSGGPTLDAELGAEDLAAAVARQLGVEVVPELLDLGGETLRVVGDYRIPLKVVLPGGDRGVLSVSVQST